MDKNEWNMDSLEAEMGRNEGRLGRKNSSTKDGHSTTQEKKEEEDKVMQEEIDEKVKEDKESEEQPEEDTMKKQNGGAMWSRGPDDVAIDREKKEYEERAKTRAESNTKP